LETVPSPTSSLEALNATLKGLIWFCIFDSDEICKVPLQWNEAVKRIKSKTDAMDAMDEIDAI